MEKKSRIRRADMKNESSRKCGNCIYAEIILIPGHEDVACDNPKSENYALEVGSEYSGCELFSER